MVSSICSSASGCGRLEHLSLLTEILLMSETKRPHGSRFRDSLVIINPGASNPSGVTLSIAYACRELREHENADTKSICQDPQSG
jgi:hypothetical protein